jgi:serine O-acetyltransferase
MLSVLRGIRGDAKFFSERFGGGNGPALELFRFLIHPSHTALWLVRLAAEGPLLLSMIARRLLLITYACDVERGAKLAPGISIPHPFGLVIGPGVVVERGVTIFQNVTLGGSKGDYPTVREGATLFSSCVVVGSSVVGEHAQVGALVFINGDVPAGGTVAGGTLLREPAEVSAD